MKNSILIIALAGCVALGILTFKQSNAARLQNEELTPTKQQVAALQAELTAKSEAVESAKVSEAKTEILQKTLAESTTVAVKESRKAEQLTKSLEEAKTNSPLHSIASMLKDPQMRDMVKTQQKAVIGPLIDRQYADFIRQLNLPPDQAAAFRDLIGKKMLAGTDAGLAMIDDSMDATQRAELTQQMKAQDDDYENQLKQFLGDSNYQAYQSYEKSIPARTSISQFGDQIAGSPNALTGDQQQQMVQAMTEARSAFKFTSGLSKQDGGANSDVASMLTDENIKQYTAENEQFDAQFLARAQQILTADQLKAFQAYQTSQRSLQTMSMNLAKSMLAPAAH